MSRRRFQKLVHGGRRGRYILRSKHLLAAKELSKWISDTFLLYLKGSLHGINMFISRSDASNVRRKAFKEEPTAKTSYTSKPNLNTNAPLVGTFAQLVEIRNTALSCDTAQTCAGYMQGRRHGFSSGPGPSDGSGQRY